MKYLYKLLKIVIFSFLLAGCAEFDVQPSEETDDLVTLSLLMEDLVPVKTVPPDTDEGVEDSYCVSDFWMFEYKSDGTIAGSATNLMQCLRVMVQDMGLPLETAVRCAAVNPAKSIGIYDRYGSIAPGKVANLVLLNQELEVMTVILNGEEYNGLLIANDIVHDGVVGSG